MPAAKNSFTHHLASLESPIRNVEDVTPSDAEDLEFVTRAIHVTGTSGLIKVTTLGGQDTNIYVAQGNTKPIQVTRIWATGTAATGIRGES